MKNAPARGAMKSNKFVFCGDDWTIKYPKEIKEDGEYFKGRVFYSQNTILVEAKYIGSDTLLHELFEAALFLLGHRLRREESNHHPKYIFMFDHGGLEDVCREVWSAYRQIRRLEKALK